MLFVKARHPTPSLFLTLRRRLATHANTPKFTIPVIDFSSFRKATSPAEKRATADRIVGAFKESGFIYLSGHGIPKSVIKGAFDHSAKFFQLPVETKDTLAWESPRSNRGYVRIGRERVTQSADAAEIAKMRESAPDYKESMEIGREADAEWKNMWPKESEAPEFRGTILGFFQTCHELQAQVMRSIALGLDLEETFFDNKVDQQCHNLRLLSYPSVKRSLLNAEGTGRAGAHSDYGTLTLLFQDQVGGLEVQNPHTKVYHPATPIPDTIVINVGDLLSRWSNDVLRSTLHRVVSPPPTPSDPDTVPGRQSIAFFSNPNFDAEIACLPTCKGTEGEKYEVVTTEEYIVGRLRMTYDSK